MVGIGLRFESKAVKASEVIPVQAIVIDQASINREKARQAELERNREVEKKRKIEEKKARQAEVRRHSELKKRQEVERQRKEAEAKRLAEEKKKKEAEAKRLAEEKKKKEAEEARRKEEASAIDALTAITDAIITEVRQNWVVRKRDQEGLMAIIEVSVKRDGTVISAKIHKSSNDPGFDSSVLAAVQKASPLPFPKNPKYYEYIKVFRIKYNQEPEY